MTSDEESFSKPEEYDRLIELGLRLSGEDREYFARGRVEELIRALPSGFRPRRVLDFGCGVGDTTSVLAKRFSGAEVVGVDVKQEVVEFARRRQRDSRCTFSAVSELTEVSAFDVCYMNGVLHHVENKDRGATLRSIASAVRPQGVVAVFENNPASIPARMVMARIPFDEGASMVWPRNCRRLLTAAGFVCGHTRYLFYFPRSLSMLRGLEPALKRVPLGAQYAVVGRKRA